MEQTHFLKFIIMNLIKVNVISPWNIRWMKDFLPIIVRSILFALGFHRVKVKGKLALPSEAPVTVIAPHSSFLDILLLSEYGKAPSGISKMENLNNPFLGGEFVSESGHEFLCINS